MLDRDRAGVAFDAREAGLPKWAQYKMTNLRRVLDEQAALVEQMRLATDPEGSAAVIYRPGDDPIGLGNVTIEFRTSGGRFQVRVAGPRDDLGDQGIRVTAQDGRILVGPSASNSVQVESKPWFE